MTYLVKSQSATPRPPFDLCRTWSPKVYSGHVRSGLNSRTVLRAAQAERRIAVASPVARMHVNYHALAVDVGGLEPA
jgi:hypothetical protein